MYKFRSESWGRKIGNEREWSTTYSDVITGYGYFHANTIVHTRKQPKGDGERFRRYPRAPESLMPKVDHMWDALRRKGFTNNGNARSRLSWYLRTQHKHRVLENSEKKDGSWKPGKERNQTRNRNTKLPPTVKWRKDDVSFPSTVLLHADLLPLTRDTTLVLASGYCVPVTCYSRHLMAAPDNTRMKKASPRKKACAGLPLEWHQKAAHHVTNPPPRCFIAVAEVYPALPDLTRRGAVKLRNVTSGIGSAPVLEHTDQYKLPEVRVSKKTFQKTDSSPLLEPKSVQIAWLKSVAPSVDVNK